MNTISLDLGTSNTQLACVDATGRSKNIGEIFPTALYVDKEQQSIYVGQAAVNKYEDAVYAGKANAEAGFLEKKKRSKNWQCACV